MIKFQWNEKLYFLSKTLGELNIISGVQNRTIIYGSLVSSSFKDFDKLINGNVFPAMSYSLKING